MLTDAEIAARYVKIRPYLDERQRRLWLGVEAQALGSGGVAVIARATGLSWGTVKTILRLPIRRRPATSSEIQHYLARYEKLGRDTASDIMRFHKARLEPL